MKAMTRAKKKPSIATAAMIVALLLPAASTPGCTDGESTVEGGTFYSAVTTEPVSLDPANLQDSESVRVSKQIFDGLTDNDPENMETVPAIAESWSANADASSWTFKLKQGVAFHNGRECTAGDFVYSWNRVADPDTGSQEAWRLAAIKGFDEVRAGTAGEMSGLKAIDEYTLEVGLSYPDSQFPIVTTHPVFSPVPREAVEEYGSDGFSEHPCGTGPFSFVAWDHRNEIVIERFDGYYGGRAHLDRVVFKVYPDEEAAYGDFKAGALNDAQIPGGQYDAARVEFGERALFGPKLAVSYIGMSMSTEPMKSNQSLRQALNYAVDRDSLCETVLQGVCSPATGVVPAGVNGYRGSAMPYKYDPARAMDLMSKAFPEGLTAPEEMLLGFDAGSGSGMIVQTVRADFREIGADFVVEGYGSGTYLEMLRQGLITCFYLSWSSDYPSMDSFLYPLFHSENAGAANMTFYANPEVDRLIMEARRTPDPGRSGDLYRQAEKLILEDSPLVPLMFASTSRVVSESVGGYYRTALDDTPYDLVYLERTY